jgi:hypothetical protein
MKERMIIKTSIRHSSDKFDRDITSAIKWHNCNSQKDAMWQCLSLEMDIVKSVMPTTTPNHVNGTWVTVVRKYLGISAAV